MQAKKRDEIGSEIFPCEAVCEAERAANEVSKTKQVNAFIVVGWGKTGLADQVYVSG